MLSLTQLKTAIHTSFFATVDLVFAAKVGFCVFSAGGFQKEQKADVLQD